VLRDGKEPVNFEFALAGEYNVLNATAAAAMAANYGIDPPADCRGAQEFQEREAPAGDQSGN